MLRQRERVIEEYGFDSLLSKLHSNLGESVVEHIDLDYMRSTIHTNDTYNLLNAVIRLRNENIALSRKYDKAQNDLFINLTTLVTRGHTLFDHLKQIYTHAFIKAYNIALQKYDQNHGARSGLLPPSKPHANTLKGKARDYAARIVRDVYPDMDLDTLNKSKNIATYVTDLMWLFDNMRELKEIVLVKGQQGDIRDSAEWEFCVGKPTLTSLARVGIFCKRIKAKDWWIRGGETDERRWSHWRDDNEKLILALCEIHIAGHEMYLPFMKCKEPQKMALHKHRLYAYLYKLG